jgi:methylenetetrahydrofolate dehydrogenase (NADP+)/methenyltetrahydrofolate cyclohydrolase
MPLILDGTAPAAAIRAAALERAAAFTSAAGRRPVLAAVAIDPGPGVPLYFDVKARAFEECGAEFQAHVLPAGSSTQDLIARIQLLNAAPDVDGIFVQYPLPPDIDAQAAYDEITANKDVDGAADPATCGGDRPFLPATAEAVLRLLTHHAVPLALAHVCIIRGDAVFARALEQLFNRAGASATIASLDDRAARGPAPGALHTADVIVAATGVVNGINAAAFRDGAVVVDVGYYHGGGRGDIAAHPDDIARFSAYASPRGSIGPLTVAILIEQTIDAAVLLAGRRMEK